VLHRLIFEIKANQYAKRKPETAAVFPFLIEAQPFHSHADIRLGGRGFVGAGATWFFFIGLRTEGNVGRKCIIVNREKLILMIDDSIISY